MAFIIPFILLNIYYLTTNPSSKGPWQPHYEQLASINVDENMATINNFRRMRYDESGNVVSIDWSNRIVNLDKLEGIWYGLSIFASPGLAHTFLSFDFGDEDPVVISVEARMRPGQQYHPLEGALDNYNLTYVFADEKDIIGVRTHLRGEQVNFMPILVEKKRIQMMFLAMVKRTNSLTQKPEFYNTFTSNCTNNIMQQTKVAPWQYYLDPRIILPGYSDSIAYEFKVLNQDYSLETIRAAARINPDHFSLNDDDFYTKIRANYFAVLLKSSITQPYLAQRNTKTP